MKAFFSRGIWLFVIAITLLICFCINSKQIFANSIRKIEISPDKIATIHTALGYSTMIEFPDKPTSAVLGDQDAFKLEYVGKSITVKPLMPNAKSNLFVFTEQERFNCTLQIVSPSEVDYLVKVVHSMPANAVTISEKLPEISSKRATFSVNKLQLRNGFGLRVINYSKIFDAKGQSRALEIQFELFSKKHPYVFSGRSLGLKQGVEFLNIESLFLSHSRVAPGEPIVQGKILVLSALVSKTKPLQLIFAVPSELKHKGRVCRLSVNVML